MNEDPEVSTWKGGTGCTGQSWQQKAVKGKWLMWLEGVEEG